jgi:hypothetical protein
MRWPPLASLPLQRAACLKDVAGLIGRSFADHCGRALAKCTVMSKRRTTTRSPLPWLRRPSPRPLPAPVGRGRSLGGRFWPGLMRSDPRGGRLKKSRRNREAIHGDFHSGEADVLANYASPSRLECDSSGCPLRLAKAEKDRDAKPPEPSARNQRFPDIGVRQCSRGAFRRKRIADTSTMPRERYRHD